MKNCTCQAKSFTVNDSPARRQWLKATGVGGAMALTAITPFVSSLLPSERAKAAGPPVGPGGFLCPCHGSTFDFAGRVFKNKPAPTNLEIPPHTYLSEGRLIIGSDKNGTA